MPLGKAAHILDYQPQGGASIPQNYHWCDVQTTEIDCLWENGRCNVALWLLFLLDSGIPQCVGKAEVLESHHVPADLPRQIQPYFGIFQNCVGKRNQAKDNSIESTHCTWYYPSLWHLSNSQLMDQHHPYNFFLNLCNQLWKRCKILDMFSLKSFIVSFCAYLELCPHTRPTHTSFL